MKLVNIMNFVRGVEPRNPELDLVKPVVEEIALNKKYGFDNTFLLQYDALIDPRFRDLFLKERDEHMELGVWIEVVRPLVEKVGIAWRGRPGFDWDWFVNPGFLPAYTYEEKTKIIDELMRKFRETFGEYPKSVGSWLLDIDSLRYMSEKYAIKAFAICREQLSVDAYTLWGGPYNQPYYPSIHNILCPAQKAENQLNVPVFRLLGIDPIRGYNEARYSIKGAGCATMEPFWSFGQSETHMRWFFKTYFDNEDLGLSFTQIGQENSFGWDGICKGLPMQIELVKEYADKGQIEVVKLCEAGERFAQSYTETPPSALCATDDAVGNAYRSFWYTSKNYRANVFFDDDFLYFRDIQKFDDTYRERYLDAPCLHWEATYDNLPVVDERCWSKEKASHDAGLDFCGKFRFDSVTREDSTLVVRAFDENGKAVLVRLEENGIQITGAELTLRFGTFTDYTLDGQNIDFTHNDHAYRVYIEGTLEKLTTEEQALRLTGDSIRLYMDR